jgi:hypothetical protein
MRVGIYFTIIEIALLKLIFFSSYFKNESTSLVIKDKENSDILSIIPLMIVRNGMDLEFNF